MSIFFVFFNLFYIYALLLQKKEKKLIVIDVLNRKKGWTYYI